MSTYELSPLVLALYRASRELPVGEFQPAALELIKPMLPFDSGWWGSVCVAGSDVAVSDVAINAVHLHDVHPELLIEYEEVKHQDVCASTLLSKGSGIYRFHSKTDSADKKRSGMRSLQQRHGQENILLSADFKPNNGFTHFVSLFRANPDKNYSDRDQYLMQALWPHLMEALTINRLIHLEHLGGGQRQFQLAIADKMGMLYHVESGFMELVREEFRSPVVDRLPSRLIAALADSGRFAGNSMVIQGCWSAELLFLKARMRLPVDGLSNREINIARLFAQGRSHQDIACTLNVSPSTVRSHIKNVYKKLGVNSKAQLLAQIDSA